MREWRKRENKKKILMYNDENVMLRAMKCDRKKGKKWDRRGHEREHQREKKRSF